MNKRRRKTCRNTEHQITVACHHASATPSGALTPFGCCSRKACGHLQAACPRKSNAVDLEGCPPCPGSSLSRCRWCHLPPHRALWFCQSTSSRRSACRHATATPSGALTPFGCCSRKACGHLQAACPRKSNVVGRVGSPPCPGSLLSRCRWCHLPPHPT